jgi:hypothetical protein
MQESKEVGKITIITAVATKKPDLVKSKGELMEGNIDAMEVLMDE